MTKPNRVLLALMLSVAVACSEAPTVPAATTTTITGTVTTSAPTFAPLAGVTLTVLDGPAAGKSITTTENGGFAFSIVKGPFTVIADKDGYDDQELTIDVAGPQTLRFTLKPQPAEIGAVLTPAMGAPCPDPCRRVYALPIHNNGTVSAFITWPAVPAPHVSLWRGDERVSVPGFCVGNHTGSYCMNPVPVSGGAVYYLRVDGSPATAPLNYHLTVRRPN
jgi:hypothetical protein